MFLIILVSFHARLHFIIEKLLKKYIYIILYIFLILLFKKYFSLHIIQSWLFFRLTYFRFYSNVSYWHIWQEIGFLWYKRIKYNHKNIQPWHIKLCIQISHTQFGEKSASLLNLRFQTVLWDNCKLTGCVSDGNLESGCLGTSGCHNGDKWPLTWGIWQTDTLTYRVSNSACQIH